jgi:guanylate cyclase
MLANVPRTIALRLERITADPGDSAEARVQKTIVVVSSLIAVGTGVFWTLLYLALGELWAAVITLVGYSGLMALNTVIFTRTRNYPWYFFSQLFLALILPFFLTISLGGLLSSGAVILWALFGPLGGVVQYGWRRGLVWFWGYAALVIACALLPPALVLGGPRPVEVSLILFILNIVGVSSFPFVTLRYFVTERDRAFGLLRLEQEKSETLLLNILPEEIAARLKEDTSTIANHYDAATILFADVVNFTPLSTILSPTQAVDLLNEIFSHFDALAEHYDLEKIKTIGDGYMVAGGVPTPRPDHAQAVARMALDMLAYIRARPVTAGTPLDIRIGLNSGPVVAGVIGQKKFLYDLWGDTVNTASRMESHGEPGQIQISQATYALIKDEFVCERRGLILVKGKGEMETWFLRGIAPERAGPPAPAVPLPARPAERVG